MKKLSPDQIDMLVESVVKFIADFQADKAAISAATMNPDISAEEYRSMYTALVGKSTSRTENLASIMQLDDEEEIEVHKNCGGLVRGIGKDGISYCEDCEHICEGDTEYITESEWEKRNV